MAVRSAAQLGLLAIGLVIWGYGARVDNANARLAGLVFFAAAAGLRFFRRRTSGNDSSAT